MFFSFPLKWSWIKSNSTWSINISLWVNFMLSNLFLSHFSKLVYTFQHLWSFHRWASHLCCVPKTFQFWLISPHEYGLRSPQGHAGSEKVVVFWRLVDMWLFLCVITYLWMGQQTVFTDFQRCSWGHAVISTTELDLFLCSATWGPKGHWHLLLVFDLVPCVQWFLQTL